MKPLDLSPKNRYIRTKHCRDFSSEQLDQLIDLINRDLFPTKAQYLNMAQKLNIDKRLIVRWFGTQRKRRQIKRRTNFRLTPEQKRILREIFFPEGNRIAYLRKKDYEPLFKRLKLKAKDKPRVNKWVYYERKKFRDRVKRGEITLSEEEKLKSIDPGTSQTVSLDGPIYEDISSDWEPMAPVKPVPTVKPTILHQLLSTPLNPSVIEKTANWFVRQDVKVQVANGLFHATDRLPFWSTVSPTY